MQDLSLWKMSKEKVHIGQILSKHLLFISHSTRFCYQTVSIQGKKHGLRKMDGCLQKSRPFHFILLHGIGTNSLHVHGLPTLNTENKAGGE